MAVRDDGPGFPPEEVQRVFEPFVRLDDARRHDDGGSGLGLSIVAATVQQLGGTVHAYPGPGGHVEVRLPTVASRPVDARTVEATPDTA